MKRPASVQLYAVLLRLLPRRMRERCGSDMESLFAWQLERIEGRWPRLRFVLAAYRDVARQAVSMRLAGMRRTAGPGAAVGSSELTSTGSGRRRPTVEQLLGDLRLGMRNMVRRPGLTVPVVATLGLGIGMATAMVAVTRGVVFRPLPFPDADRLVVVHERTAEGGLLAASYLNFADWRESGRAFSALAAVVGPRNMVVLGGAAPARVPASFVSADYFRVAGVEPVVGRIPGPEENRPGAPPVVVVGHSFWLESLGGEGNLDGATLTFQNLFGVVESHAVIGVMPPGFDLLGEADVYASLDRAVPWNVRGNHVVHVVGRLESTAAIEVASRDLDRVQAGIRARFGNETEAVGVGMRPLHEEVVGSVRTPVLLLLIGALLLLVAAFLNAAGALLARGVARRREFGVRVSLGATRGRLLSQLVLESALHALGALLVGLFVARALLALLTTLAPSAIPRLDDLGASLPELAAAATGLVLIGMLLFGVATAVLSTRGDAGLMRDRSAGWTRGTRMLWRTLIAVEVAVALMLMTTAGILGRSLRGIVTAETGFESRGVLTAEIDLPPRPDADPSSIVRFFETALDELRSMPGVESAGLSHLLPVPGGSGLAGPVRLESGESGFGASYRVADAGFFEVLGIRLLQGRLFDERDVEGAAHATVINTTMARMLFGDADPIGRRFHLGAMDPYRDDWLTVVGVVEEARPWTAEPGTFPVYYVDFRQRPIFLAFTSAEILVRTRDTALAGTIRDRLAAIEPDVPVRVRTLDGRLSGRTADRRFVLLLLAVFATLALVLTGVGIWGVISFVASRKTRDMSIRLALGASPGRVLRGLQWETGPPVVLGIVLGTLAAGSLTRLVRAHLYGVGTFDPMSLVAVAVTIVFTAWFASYLPARRTKRLDPVVTLRDS